jgi:hypothetical protein
VKFFSGEVLGHGVFNQGRKVEVENLQIKDSTISLKSISSKITGTKFPKYKAGNQAKFDLISLTQSLVT